MNEKFYALSEEKRSQILNAAYKVFATNQYKKAPTSEIAAVYIPFQVNHLHGQTEPVPRRMRATLTETEPVLFDANYQATVC